LKRLTTIRGTQLTGVAEFDCRFSPQASHTSLTPAAILARVHKLLERPDREKATLARPRPRSSVPALLRDDEPEAGRLVIPFGRRDDRPIPRMGSGETTDAYLRGISAADPESDRRHPSHPCLGRFDALISDLRRGRETVESEPE
jgi:hypothetical protein